MAQFLNKIYKHLKNEESFTLVELLIVISIISVLSTLSIGSYSNVMKNGRDTKRKADLRKVQIALEQYYAAHGTFRVDGGANWTDPKCGCGWLSYVDGGYYRRSVIQALHDEGFLQETHIEDPRQEPGYMIYICEGGKVYSLTATLENPNERDIEFARDHTCNGNGSNGTVTRYGKNYAITNKTY